MAKCTKNAVTKTSPEIWSATPTPFTNTMKVDAASIKKMVDHHIKLGVKGLFLAGTCGEGPWMPDYQKQELFEHTAKHAKGKLRIAVQVTDNSAARILENIKVAKNCGADIAVIAPPYFMNITTPARIFDLYQEAIQKSPLPVGIYDRGKHSSIEVPASVLKKIYSEDNVILAKDSSADMSRMKIALSVKKKRPELKLLTGWEFNTVPYIENGYDGVLLGGGIFNGYMAGLIIEAVKAGDLEKANALQERMNEIMYQVFGGKSIKCWLSGQKKLLVDMGVFKTWKSYLNYPLTPACERAITKVIKKDADMLFPWKG